MFRNNPLLSSFLGEGPQINTRLRRFSEDSDNGDLDETSCAVDNSLYRSNDEVDHGSLHVKWFGKNNSKRRPLFCQLVVSILRAEDLVLDPSKDRHCDPFCEISISGKKQRTKIKRRKFNSFWFKHFSCNPRWDETLVFERVSTREKLLVRVIDFNDSIAGECKVSISQLLEFEADVSPVERILPFDNGRLMCNFKVNFPREPKKESNKKYPILNTSKLDRLDSLKQLLNKKNMEVSFRPRGSPEVTRRLEARPTMSPVSSKGPDNQHGGNQDPHATPPKSFCFEDDREGSPEAFVFEDKLDASHVSTEPTSILYQGTESPLTSSDEDLEVKDTPRSRNASDAESKQDLFVFHREKNKPISNNPQPAIIDPNFDENHNCDGRRPSIEESPKSLLRNFEFSTTRSSPRNSNLNATLSPQSLLSSSFSSSHEPCKNLKNKEEENIDIKNKNVHNVQKEKTNNNNVLQKNCNFQEIITKEQIKNFKMRELKDFLKKNSIPFKRTSRRFQLQKLAIEFLEEQQQEKEQSEEQSPSENKNNFENKEKISTLTRESPDNVGEETIQNKRRGSLDEIDVISLENAKKEDNSNKNSKNIETDLKTTTTPITKINNNNKFNDNDLNLNVDSNDLINENELIEINNLPSLEIKKRKSVEEGQPSQDLRRHSVEINLEKKKRESIEESQLKEQLRRQSLELDSEDTFDDISADDNEGGNDFLTMFRQNLQINQENTNNDLSVTSMIQSSIFSDDKDATFTSIIGNPPNNFTNQNDDYLTASRMVQSCFNADEIEFPTDDITETTEEIFFLSKDQVKKLKMRELKNFLMENHISFKRTARRKDLEQLAFEIIDEQQEKLKKMIQTPDSCSEDHFSASSFSESQSEKTLNAPSPVRRSFSEIMIEQQKTPDESNSLGGSAELDEYQGVEEEEEEGSDVYDPYNWGILLIRGEPSPLENAYPPEDLEILDASEFFKRRHSERLNSPRADSPIPKEVIEPTPLFPSPPRTFKPQIESVKKTEASKRTRRRRKQREKGELLQPIAVKTPPVSEPVVKRKKSKEKPNEKTKLNKKPRKKSLKKKSVVESDKRDPKKKETKIKKKDSFIGSTKRKRRGSVELDISDARSVEAQKRHTKEKQIREEKKKKQPKFSSTKIIMARRRAETKKRIEAKKEKEKQLAAQEARVEKKLGPRDIGRKSKQSYQAPDYNLPEDNQSFLAPRWSTKRKGPQHINVRQLGPRDIGRKKKKSFQMPNYNLRKPSEGLFNPRLTPYKEKKNRERNVRQLGPRDIGRKDSYEVYSGPMKKMSMSINKPRISRCRTPKRMPRKLGPRDIGRKSKLSFQPLKFPSDA